VKKLFLSAAIMLLIAPLMVSGIVVGLNDDIHFNYDGVVANDFHIEGNVHSSGGIWPKITDIHVIGDPGSGIWVVDGYCLTQVGPDDWFFTCDFSTNGYIQFCQWIHFGIMFNVEGKNIITNLVGWWTLDGIPLMSESSLEDVAGLKQVAITGFDVYGETPETKKVKIMNHTNMPVEMPEYEVAISLEPIPLEDMFTYDLGNPGEPSPKYPQLVWVKIPTVPSILYPDQEFEFRLADYGILLQPGQYLLMRGEQFEVGSKVMLQGLKANGNDASVQTNFPWGFFWEQHGE